MLIVFRAEHAACLKHSSLFKVNCEKLFFWKKLFLWVFWVPPLPCRSGPEEGGLTLRTDYPQTQLRAGGEHPRNVRIFLFDFPCLDALFEKVGFLFSNSFLFQEEKEKAQKPQTISLIA
jgi:hypothetical protein